jgi:RNA polymerase sigma factor (sigma-70 family)
MQVPDTRLSVIVAAGSADPEARRAAFATIAEFYWKPVYKYVRVRWRVTPEEAEDLTQGFFARALEKNYFAPYDSTRARFRTFLRTCLDGFIANARQAEGRLKRGGGARLVPLDIETAEGELRRHDVSVPADLDQYFEREWARSVLATAVARFHAACEASDRQLVFRVFERYDLQDPEHGERVSYGDLARELGVSTADVTNRLAAARREFRRIVLGCLRDLTSGDEEFRAEARRLLGIEVM